MYATLITTRTGRVSALLLAIALLSFLDLGLTVGLMSSGGMFESNPIARGLVQATGSPMSLAVFKIGSLLLAVAILLPLRQRFSSELACWVGAALLLFVTIQWGLYLNEMQGIDLSQLNTLGSADQSWVKPS